VARTFKLREHAFFIHPPVVFGLKVQ